MSGRDVLPRGTGREGLMIIDEVQMKENKVWKKLVIYRPLFGCAYGSNLC